MQVGNFTIKPGQMYFGMAIIMALACGLVMKSGGDKDTPSTKPELVKEATTPVVVASYPVHAGDVIQPDQLQVVEWPIKLLPVGQTFQDLSTLVGKAVKADVFQGEPVFREKLANPDANGGLPVLIPKGLRAVTIAVSEVKGVAGFIKPGDKVDVLATFELKDNTKSDQMTKTVLQNVLVIAAAQDMKKSDLPTPEDYPELEAKKRKAEKADQKADASPEDAQMAEEKRKAEEEEEEKKKAEEADAKNSESADKKNESAKLVSSVTLAVTPAQAEKLALAEDTGTIRLILRPDSDPETVSVSGVKQSQLTGVTSKPVAIGKPVITVRPRYQVEVIQGTEKGKVSF